MKRPILTAALGLLLLTTQACAGIAFVNHKVPLGAIYAETGSNEVVTENKLGAKRGEACATSVLGWVTTGDASVAAAAKSAGISEVGAVDHTFTNILGVYAKYCAVVYGD